MKLLDERGLTTVWAAIKNTFTSKSDADEKYAKKNEALLDIDIDYTEHDITINTYHVDNIDTGNTTIDSATSTYAGVMTAADKNKLDNIEEDANNYFLPLAANGTRGGIQLGHASISASDRFQYPLLVDGNEKAYVSIPYATSGLDGLMTSQDKDKLDGIASGANNYTLPRASSTALGGIKTSVDYDQYHCFPICTDTNGVAYTKIDSISLFDGSTTSYTATENTNYTAYGCNEINNKVGSSIFTLRFPFESGTLALKSDIPDVPDVSDLCKANLVYDISKCKEGSINIFVNNSSKDFSIDSIKDKYRMVVFAYVVENCNITANVNMILYNNVPNFTGKVSVTPGMFLIIPNQNNIAIFSF